MSNDIVDIYSNRRLNWGIITVLVVLHAGAIAALFMFSWRALAVTIFLHWLAVGLGISMGYHRLHTHRSYKLPRLLEYFLAICGTLSLEGGPIFWVATHRIHHQFSDKPGDPHSPHDGAWWAHIGWILVGESKHNNTKLMAKYAPDLAKDPFYVQAEQLPLGLSDSSGRPALRDWRPAASPLGYVRPPGFWTARHLGGEFSHAHVGQPPIQHARRFPQ